MSVEIVGWVLTTVMLSVFVEKVVLGVLVVHVETVEGLDSVSEGCAWVLLEVLVCSPLEWFLVRSKYAGEVYRTMSSSVEVIPVTKGFGVDAVSAVRCRTVAE